MSEGTIIKRGSYTELGMRTDENSSSTATSRSPPGCASAFYRGSMPDLRFGRNSNRRPTCLISPQCCVCREGLVANPNECALVGGVAGMKVTVVSSSWTKERRSSRHDRKKRECKFKSEVEAFPHTPTQCIRCARSLPVDRCLAMWSAPGPKKKGNKGKVNDAQPPRCK